MCVTGKGNQSHIMMPKQDSGQRFKWEAESRVRRSQLGEERHWKIWGKTGLGFDKLCLGAPAVRDR